VTIGISVITWADVLHTAVRQMSNDTEALRASVPLGFAAGRATTEGAPPLPTFTEATLMHALEEIRRGYAATAQSAGFLVSRPESEEVGPETVLERRPGVVCSWSPTTEGARLDFLDQELLGPKEMSESYRFVATMKRFRVIDCPCPGSNGGKVEWIQRMIATGLLRPTRVR
jgi:hypothetical protein